MHIVDTTMFYAPQSGGVKRYLLAKRQWLAKQDDVRHTLLVPGGADTPSEPGIVRMAALPLPFTGGYRFPLRQQPWRRQLLALEPDLIEAADPYCVPWAAKAAAQALGVPAIAFHHSDVSRLLSARVGSWAMRPIGRYLRALYQDFDVVLAPSRVILDKLEAAGVYHTRLQPLGVDAELFHPGRGAPARRRELGLPPGTRLLVFAGRFSKEKNIPALFDAFRRLGPKYHLLLIGGSRRRRVGNVTQLPYQGGGQQLARYLASADAMVHAGDAETFGLVMAEAMACGLPVVGVDCGAVPELIDSSVGELVPRATGAALAEGVQALFERDVAAVGRLARRRVEQRYSWDQVLGGLLALYRQLAGKAEATAGGRQRVAL